LSDPHAPLDHVPSEKFSGKLFFFLIAGFVGFVGAVLIFVM
jgi:hypothetical protein